MSVVEAPSAFPKRPCAAILSPSTSAGSAIRPECAFSSCSATRLSSRVGELVERLGLAQPKVSTHLACLRWCGFIQARREHRTVYNRIADERVVKILDLAHALLDDNAEHVAASVASTPN